VRYTAVSATLTGENKRTSSSRLGSMQLGLGRANSFPGWSISKLDTPSPLGRNSEAFRNVCGGECCSCPKAYSSCGLLHIQATPADLSRLANEFMKDRQRSRVSQSFDSRGLM
jgi:hypothetical protein